MTTITIELDKPVLTTRIKRGKKDWVDVSYDLTKAHNDWLVQFIRKGVGRWANDKYSDSAGQTKVDQCEEIARMVNDGEPIPDGFIGRGSGTSTPADPRAEYILNRAKGTLKNVFKDRGYGSFMKDWADHETAKKYFKERSGVVIWNDDVVDAWIVENGFDETYGDEYDRQLDKLANVQL